MIESRLKAMELELGRLEQALLEMAPSSPEYVAAAKRHAELKELLEMGLAWREKKKEMEDLLLVLKGEKDEEMRDLVRQEIERLEGQIADLESRLKGKLFGEDDGSVKSVILEIRAGAGGEEAALFARELFNMYMKYAEKKRWKTELMDMSLSDLGGFKEVVLAIESKEAYRHLRYESGVHRVQRVPETESQGRIHTSTVTVAVLPEPDEVEVQIRAEDLRVEVFRASGPGGQHVNRTESAVRITHIPTGITVSCQDERSQHRNRAKAMRLLRARLKDKLEQERQREISEQRRRQVGTAERSEKIRTYNFPQGRVTDHRVGLTLYKLEDVLEGELDELIVPLIERMKAKEMVNSDS